MTNDELKVKSILTDLIGSGLVVSGRRLASMAEIENTAHLRTIIHSLRVQGEPICSSNAGYWMARTDEELMESSKQIERFAISVLCAARGMRSKLVNQIGIDGGKYE